MKVAHLGSPRLSHLTVFAGLLTLCPVAIATVDISLRLDTSWGHNSNLFRNDTQTGLGGNDSPTQQARTPTATSVQTHGAHVSLALPLGSPETRLVLSTSLNAQKFGAANPLGHTARTNALRLPWRYTALWDGEFSAGNASAAFPVDDFYSQLDIVDRRWASAIVRLKPTPDIQIPLRFTSATARHADRAVHGQLDEDLKSTTVSVLYRSGLGNSAELGVVNRQIDFPNRTGGAGANGHEEHERDTFVELLWVQSPMTQMGLRWASRLKTSTDSRSTSSRENVARFFVSHALSPFMRLEAQAWRQPYQNTSTQASQTNYGISNGRGLGIVWTPSHRTLLRFDWQKDAQRDLPLFGAGGSVTSALNPATQRFALRAEYGLERGFTAFLGASHERRLRRERDTSTQTVWLIGLEYRYENLPGAALRTQPATLPSP